MVDQAIWEAAWKISYGEGDVERGPADEAAVKLESLIDSVRPKGEWTVSIYTAKMLLANLAQQRMRLGQWEVALELWETVNERDVLVPAYIKCLWKLHRFDQAEEECRKWLDGSFWKFMVRLLIELWREEELERHRLETLIRESLPPALAKRAEHTTIEEIENLLLAEDKAP